MSTPLQLLSATEAKRAALPWPDVYFSPEYGLAEETLNPGERWEVAVYEPGPIVQPYLVRPIDAALGAEDAFDISSPYGYAGAWAPADVPPDAWRDFRRRFREALRERGAVAEFLRLSALVPGAASLAAADPELEVTRISETIALDLRDGHDALWRGAKKRSRTAVRKAKKLGYEVSFERATPEALAPGGAFRALYEGTMRRVEAAPRYFFSDAYYTALCDTDLWLGRVARDGNVVAASLFMRAGELLHYHLAGSDREAARDGVNNLLLDAAAQWGCEGGQHTLHLGGGVRRGDALFKFKAGFGGRELPFSIGRAVIDPERYATLVTARARALDRDRDALMAGGFFPAYRAC